MAFRTDPEKYPCPELLALGRQLGENRMLVSGGLLDQPIEWDAIQYAVGIDQYITRSRIKDFKPEPEETKLHDEIIEIVKELATRV